MNPPLIECTAHDSGEVTYRVRPSNYGPVEYAVILAQLIRYVAGAIAADKKLDADMVEHQLTRNIIAALDEKDDSAEPIRMLN